MTLIARQAGNIRANVRPAYEAALLRLHGEAGGAYQLLLIEPADVIGFAHAAASGDRLAGTYLRVLNTFASRMNRARRNAPLCLTCDRSLTKRTRASFIGIFHGLRDDPSEYAVGGVCSFCAAQHKDQAGIASAVVDVLRQMFPDLRLISTPIHAAGQA